MRGDDRGLLVGHDAISAFRGARGGVATRSLTHVEVRPLTEDRALVVSVSRFAAGGQGLQTQLWRRDGEGDTDTGAGPRWRIGSGPRHRPPESRRHHRLAGRRRPARRTHRRGAARRPDHRRQGPLRRARPAGRRGQP
ncbi:DUF3225 domain-containing protein [Curtobacterium flaccumfaciens]|nr:DUF3225 domain-containing protein [Curtobacterium flaccumfaciens]